METKLLLRPDEAAEAMGVSRSKVYALIANRKIPSIRIGHSVRVPIAALREWIDCQLAGGVMPERLEFRRMDERSEPLRRRRATDLAEAG